MLGWMQVPWRDGLYGAPRNCRSRPDELVPGTLRDFRTAQLHAGNSRRQRAVLDDPEAAFVSRYALGRDYHKVLRQKLQSLADRMSRSLGVAASKFGYRVFTDSAPVMEVALAKNAGPWVARQTRCCFRASPAPVFLGDYPRCPLPVDVPVTEHRVRARAASTCALCSHCRAVQTRRAPLHFVSHHRARDPIPVELRHERSATGFTDATIANWRP